MPDELVEAFISQMIDILYNIESSLENLLQFYQVSIEDGKSKESIITKEKIKDLLIEITQNGKTADVKKLLNKYGVDKLSALSQEDYKNFYLEAKKL